jgi:acyl carrier protein
LPDGDGDIEYLGRNDFQVKIHGFRIELGEIEAKMALCPGVKQAVALAKEQAGGDKRLVGYYVAEDKLDEEDMRKRLETTLPYYMVPSAFARLEALPLTVNGKLDRKALPEPVLRDENEYEAPANAMEKKLCSLYGEVLGLKPDMVSAHADFFKLGGDSIRSIQLASRIQRQTQCQIKIKDIFAYRTVRKLYSAFAINNETEQRIQNEQGMLRGEFPLFPSQKHFLYNMNINTAPAKFYDSFVIPCLIAIEHIDEETLMESLVKLVEQHDAFRLCFKKDPDNTVRQYYSEDMPEIKLYKYDAGALEINERKIEIEKTLTSWIEKLRIFSGPLFLFGVITGFDDGKARLYMLINHLAADGVSARILGNDFETIYAYLKDRKAI